MEMTEQLLRQLCVKNKGYRTPSLNDQLYLHFNGFTHLANLDAYTGAKSMYLEGNALSSFEGLPRLEQLMCLFAQQNVITSLKGLENVPQLRTLNLGNNHLSSLHGIEACPELSTLTASANQLASLSGLEPLLSCKELQTLDLQCNKIEDPAIVDLVAQLPALRCLYLKGNPVVNKIKQYRKALIAALPGLTYLDDRPVDEQERRCAEAWSSGGIEAEREERQKYKDEQAERDRRNHEFIANLRREGFRKRRQMLGLPEGDTDPFFDTLGGGSADVEVDSSDEERDTVRDQEADGLEEPPELRAARAALAAYTARPGEEEPPELTRARQELVRNGGVVQQGSWSASAAAEDGAIYLASVASAQRDLDAAGPGLMATQRGNLAFRPAAVTAAAAGGGARSTAAPAAAGGGAAAAAALAAAQQQLSSTAGAAAAAGSSPAAGSAAKEDASPPSMRVSRDDSWGSEVSGGSGQEGGSSPVGLEQVDLGQVGGEGSSQQVGTPAAATTTTILDMDELD